MFEEPLSFLSPVSSDNELFENRLFLLLPSGLRDMLADKRRLIAGASLEFYVRRQLQGSTMGSSNAGVCSRRGVNSQAFVDGCGAASKGGSSTGATGKAVALCEDTAIASSRHSIAEKTERQ